MMIYSVLSTHAFARLRKNFSILDGVGRLTIGYHRPSRIAATSRRSSASVANLAARAV